MGRRSCDPPVLPVRPAMEFCIANSDGSAECFDSRQNPPNYQKPIVNHVCTNANDYTTQEEWVKQVIEACK